MSSDLKKLINQDYLLVKFIMNIYIEIPQKHGLLLGYSISLLSDLH